MNAATTLPKACYDPERPAAYPASALHRTAGLWQRLPRAIRYCSLMALLCCCADVRAAVFTVTNTADAGAGSLRDAITSANSAGTGPHSIVFSASGTINLSSALPSVTNANVTIDGGNSIIISANVNDVDRDCFTIGANNTTLKNITLQNTGGEGIYVNGVLSGVTIDNVTIRNMVNDWINHGIYVNNKATNMTIRNVTMTDIQDNFWGIRFINTVTNLTVDGFHMYNGGGGTARGIQIQGAASGVTIKNSNIDLDDPATTNDGDYGIYFNSTAANVVLDSSFIHDAEVYPFYIGGAATNVRISNTALDNFDGNTATQFIRFNSTATQVYINNINMNADLHNSTNDGDYGIVFAGNLQRAKITNSVFNEIDYRAIQVSSTNNDSVLIDGNTFTDNGVGGGYGTIEFYGMRNTTSDGFPVVISNNIIKNTNGIPIYLRPGDGGNYTVPNVTVKNNTITGAKSRLGAIQLNYIDKVNVTQNYIYNVQGIALDLVGAANCGYEGANKPQLLSSAETAPGIYSLQLKMPAACGTGNCTVEVFSTEAGMRGTGGQHYVTTLTGLPSGISTRSVSGSFNEMLNAPYGVFTATMKVANNNCGTSEYSNKIGIKPIGPAGVDQGVQAWMNPDIVEDGNMLNGEGWEDFSGLARNFTGVAGDPARVTGGLNTNHYVNFDGNDYVYPGTPGFVKTMPAGEVITVTKSNSTTTTNGSPYDFGGNSNHHYTWTNGYVYNDFGTNDRFGWHPVTKAIIDAHPGATVINGSTIDVKKWNIYGTHAGPGNWGVDFNGRQQYIQTATNTINFTLGANREYVGATHGYPYNGDIAETALWNRVLTDLERQRVNSYYAVKFGLTLNQNYVASDGTTVWWNLTTNTGYNKGIAGLARDKRSVLHQRQSHSVAIDDIVTFGVGDRFFSTFEDDDANIANDKSAFMWGTDSGSTNFSIAYATAYSDYRMARRWKVQKTNWSDTTIVVKLSKGNRNRTLIISNDPTFATGVSNYRLNDTGAVVLNSSSFTNGAYFTFANVITAPACVTLGIQGWYRADDPSATGATWGDFSGYDRDATQATVASQPTKVAASMNYNASFDFDGGDRMAIPNTLGIAGTGDWTVLGAAVSEAAGLQALIGSDNATLGRTYQLRLNPGAVVYSGTRSTGACGVTSTATTALNVPVLVGATRTGNSWNTYVNNIAGTAATCTNNLLGNYWLGWHNLANTDYMNGKVGEIIVYNRALSTGELQTVNSYLAIKYGITMSNGTQNYLASSGVTIWDATVNAAYKNSIAGIGKDTCGSFHQRQSRSVNAGTLVALGIGEALGTSNLDNPYNIINNISYLTWGDNNLGTAFTTNVTGASATVRMPRVWKVQKTNWADSFITVKFSGNVVNTSLLISNSDPTFGTVDQELAISADSTVTFNSSLLPTGAYFTFGKAIVGPGYVNNGIQAWYRSDMNAAVNNWDDYSGNANDAVQTSSTSQPAVVSTGMNYLPSLKFDGINSYMDVNSQLGFSTAVSDFTVFGVTRRNTNSSLDGIIQQNATTAGGAIPLYFNAAKLVSSRNGTVIADGALSHGIKSLEITSSFRSGNSFSIFTNGNTDATGTNASGFLNLNMRIGNRSATADMAFDGQIGEIAVYNRAITAAEQARVYSYLAMKYGVTYKSGTYAYVNTDGDTIWRPTANTGYQSRVTAIGRDDKTALNQKQSRNQDTATIGYVAMALGEMAAANDANTNSFEDDRSFLLWADDNATAAPAVSVSGDQDGNTLSNGSSCLLQRRLPKTFRVTNVNNVSEVQVTVNLKGVSLAPSASDLYLAINNTSTFSGTITRLVPATSYVNGLAVFDEVIFNDGDYFTVIGEKSAAPGNIQNGLALWLEADNGVNSDDAGKVSQWDDQAINARNATQATALSQPTVTDNAINFNPALSFDGANSYMDIANSLGFSATPADFTVVGLSRRNSTANGTILSQSNVTTGSALPLYYNSTTLLTGRSGSPSVVSGSLVHSANVAEMTAVKRTGSAYAVFTNGRAEGTGTYAGGYVAGNMRVGNRLTTGDYAFNGYIGEIITYTRALDSAELNKVYTYLAIKYGVSINQATPTSYTASDGTIIWPANSTYANRIAGIGRDICSGLQQRQSVNNDAAAGSNVANVIIGLGGLAADNEANSNDFAADKSFAIWGDDNGATAFSTAFPTNSYSLSYRMGRTWKVAESGTVGAVRVAMPYNRIANPAKAYLVVNNGSTAFSSASDYYALDTQTINGVLHYYADVDLNNNDYFTFASDVKVPGGVAGQSLWMRPDYGTSSTVDGAGLTEWSEYGAELNQGTQSGTNLPTYVNNATDNVNYNPMVKFNSGTTNGIYMNLDPTLLVGGNTARTIFGIGRPSITPATRAIISWGTGALATATGNTLGSTGTAAGNYAANGNMPSANNLWTTNTVNELVATYAGGTGGAIGLYSKNKSVLATAATRTLNTTIATGTPAYLGRSIYGATEDWNGTMGDVIVYPFELSAVQRQQVESYLAIKYGYTMDQTTPTNYLASDGSTVTWSGNTTYKYRIAGIGRDDRTGLLQRQSRNQDTTSPGFITMALDALAADNGTNDAAFGDDKSFLIWADDNVTGVTTSAVSGDSTGTTIDGISSCALARRMAKTYRVQQTGDVSNVQIQINLKGMNMGIAGDVYLAISSVPTFGSTVYRLIPATSLNNNIAVFDNVSFNGQNQYFTVLGKKVESPAGVTGSLLTWMKADDGVELNDTAVATWQDQTLALTNATTAAAANQPVYRAAGLNFNPTLDFNGTANAFDLAVNLNHSVSPAVTVYTVYRPDAAGTATTRYLWGNGISTTSRYLNQTNYSNAPTGTYLGGNTVGRATISGAQYQTNSTVPPLLGSNIWVNGAPALPTGLPFTETAANAGAATMKLGTATGSSYFDGNIAEFIVYNKTLSATEKARVESYLAIKYGITLSTGGVAPLATVPDYKASDNSTVWSYQLLSPYYRRVFGIGRDICSDLNQKQAISTDTGISMLALGLESIAASNAENMASFDADKTYVLVADNGDAVTEQTTELPGTYVTGGKRLAREWKATVTGTAPTNLALQFDLSSVTPAIAATTTEADLDLIIDTDGDGDFTTGTTTTIKAASFAGNVATFNNVRLDSGVVFTVMTSKKVVNVSAKVMLQGPLSGTTMTTTLNTANLLPTTQPYIAAPFSYAGTEAVATMPANVTDWVLVELRDPVNPATVVASRAALLTSTGDVKDLDGVSPVSFTDAPAGSYYLAIRHRNHLGVRSAATIDFSAAAPAYNFTTAATQAFGTNAQKQVGSIWAMWGGNVNGDNAIYNAASPSDAAAVSSAVANAPGNTANLPNYAGFINVYSIYDVNMDGKVYNTATPSDRSFITGNVANNPGNTANLPNSTTLIERLP